MMEDLSPRRMEIETGLDSIVVRKFTDGVVGGVTLDITAFPDPTILAGHVVITDGEVYRPMPYNGDEYAVLPEGFRYFGVIYRSSRVTQGVSVMTRGSINKYRAPYNILGIKDEFFSQCPFIILACDAEEMEAYARLEASDGVVYTSEGKEIWFRTGGRSGETEGV